MRQPPAGASTGSLGAQHASNAATSAQGAGAAAPVAAQPLAAGATASNAIVVSKRQQGNPVLKHIRNVRWVFGDIGPDYLLGANACALFLSLRCGIQTISLEG
jgi:DNA excision repair protein ERCC-1